VARIKLGLQESFSLGDITPQRDWGYAGDYVKAMWQMNQHPIAQDFIIATGATRSVKEFVLAALESAELEPDIDRYVRFDEQFVRPAEVDLLIGDPTKAKNILGWEATTTFQQLVDLMVQNDLRILVNGNYT
jgi:GDPmannose 4,6-dehydratase